MSETNNMEFDNILKEMESMITENPTPNTLTTPELSTIEIQNNQPDNIPTTPELSTDNKPDSTIPIIELEVDDEEEYYKNRKKKYDDLRPQSKMKEFYKLFDSIVEESSEKNLMKDEEELELEKMAAKSKFDKEINEFETKKTNFTSPTEAIDNLRTNLTVSSNSLHDLKKMFYNIENGIDKKEMLSPKIDNELINIESTLGNLLETYKYLKNQIQR